MSNETSRELLMRLRSVGLGVHQDLTSRLKPVGISPGELEVLRRLADTPGLTASMLGRRLDLRRQSLNEQLQSLEKRELIHRHFCFGDTRAVAWSLTDAGTKTLEEGLGVVNDLELQLLARLGLRNGRHLLSLLERAERTLHLARRMELDKILSEEALPDRLADLYTDDGFEPFPRPG